MEGSVGASVVGWVWVTAVVGAAVVSVSGTVWGTVVGTAVSEIWVVGTVVGKMSGAVQAERAHKSAPASKSPAALLFRNVIFTSKASLCVFLPRQERLEICRNHIIKFHLLQSGIRRGAAPKNPADGKLNSSHQQIGGY